MLTLFEQGDFIKEMQSLLGERLLSVGYEDTELEKEIRLVELFKTRFGADRLQSCEVMLRDIQDSRHINKALRPTDHFPTAQEVYAAIPQQGITSQALIAKFNNRVPLTDVAGKKFVAMLKSVAITDKESDLVYPLPDLPMVEPHVHDNLSAAFYTQILSSFFWPSLREDDFAVPPPISALQKSFEQDFERVKNLRKLHWLSALGKATVELELEDRTVKLEGVQTWQASVIYAFQDDGEDNADTRAATRSIQELEESLSMDELLVRNALAFWTGHRVLVETETDVFTVLEKLPSAEEEEEAGAVASAAVTMQADTAISAVKSQDAVLQDNKPMYEMFIAGMLTNGGAMDVARVTMMMKMVVPGGYNYGEDETRWLLSSLEEQGSVVLSGNTYSIKK
jgi:anaphase-promoting complex subunit 2